MKIPYTPQFKKDFKKVQKQGKDTGNLRAVIETLVKNEKLPPKYKDHQLSGNWKNHRDCHIESDWILFYRLADDELFLERTGSHSDLFKKCIPETLF